MSGYVDAINKHLNALASIYLELDALNQAFSTVGNDQLAQRLYRLSQDIKMAEEGIKSAVVKKIHKDVELSQTTSANILNAVLAGMDVGKSG